MSDDGYNSGMLIDAHCHIDLMKDPVAEVKYAEASGIHTIAVTNAPSVFFHTRNLCEGKRFVHAALGLHPELVRSHGGELKNFQEQVGQTRFVGEIGLDYVTTDQGLRKKQREVFEAILQCSADAGGRILTIHSRRSAGDVISALEAHGRNRPILHWFSGTRRELERAIAIGCYFSVNPSMLTSRSGLALVAAMPRDRVLTETDGPFVSVAGKPCTPADSKTATELLAGAWKVPFDQTAAALQRTFDRIVCDIGHAFP